MSVNNTIMPFFLHNSSPQVSCITATQCFYIILLLCITTLVGCQQVEGNTLSNKGEITPQEKRYQESIGLPENERLKQAYHLKRLFESDGTVVYRFWDEGEFRYYAAPSTMTFTITKDNKTEAIVVPVESKSPAGK
jgi:hypothetical protein